MTKIIVSVPQQIFDAIKKPVAIPIPLTAKAVCCIKLLGGGGGQGIYATSIGSSGAGGFTVYHFDTNNYLGQELKIVVGSGGEKGILGKQPGKGGYPNGGNGISGDDYSGGGGGRSEVRIGLPNQSFEESFSLAIAGGGGGGGYGDSKAGAGGGESGQNDNSNVSTGGTQLSGGKSGTTYSVNFLLAGKYQGAGPSDYPVTGQSSYDSGGGGDGYFGGGTHGGSGSPASGGSGYINKAFSGFLNKYISDESATYTGNYTQIPLLAANDPNFNVNGLGRGGERQTEAGKIPLNGGNGRVVIDFL